MGTINQEWKFQKLPQENIGEIEDIRKIQWKADESCLVNLPHTWYEEGNGYQGTAIYQKTLRLGKKPERSRVFLNFQAVDRWCRVFVNQHYAGEHKGGYSAFTLDITEACRWDAENELTVVVDNRSWDIISPLAGDFTVFGGIYRDVNLIVTNQNCFDRTYYGTQGLIARADIAENGNGKISVENHLLCADQTMVKIHYRVIGPTGEIVIEREGTPDGSDCFEIANPALWNGKGAAVLYELQGELQMSGQVIDSVSLSFGFRKVKLDAEHGFFLNGIHQKLNGIAMHQDFAEVFSAAGPVQWEQNLRDIREIGANSVRLSHYQHPQEMYRLCDQEGLIVWAEIPMLRMTESKELFENICSQLKELILQNLHHPSICFWGIQNEIAMFGENETMYERLRALTQIAECLDPTRICASANLFCVKNDSPLNRITRAVGYNIYFGWYYGKMEDSAAFVDQFHQNNPDIPLGITEYGADCSTAFHSENPKVKDYSEEFQALYHETVYPIFRERDYIWGTYVWNLYDFSSEIRDEGGTKYRNTKGLITYDRRIKKDAFYYYKAQWSSEPFVKIAQARFRNRAQETITLKIYSNQKKLDLTVNGKRHGITSENGVFVAENIPLQMGENLVNVSCKNAADEALFIRAAEPDPSYQFADPSPGLNVKNWFTDLVEEEKLFPKGKFSIRDSCKDLLEREDVMKVIEEFSPSLAKQMRERVTFMPLERVLYYMKAEFDENRCKDLNSRITKISKI